MSYARLEQPRSKAGAFFSRPARAKTLTALPLIAECVLLGIYAKTSLNVALIIGIAIPLLYFAVMVVNRVFGNLYAKEKMREKRGTGKEVSEFEKDIETPQEGAGICFGTFSVGISAGTIMALYGTDHTLAETFPAGFLTALITMIIIGAAAYWLSGKIGNAVADCVEQPVVYPANSSQ